MPKKNKTLCVDDLRHAEYYGMQPVFDELYHRSLEGENFTDLMDLILSRDNILLAYRNIKANGGSYTAGTDNKNISDIGCLPPETVAEKVRFIVTGSQHGYRPKPVRRKDIPKPNGKTRPLGIPCIWDRLVQQCIKQVIEPICEAKFSDNSYGFRPNRSVEHAVQKTYTMLQRMNLHYVIEFDIKGFFDNVNHSKLMRQIWAMGIHDKQLIFIIKRILKAPIRMPDGTTLIPDKGTPQVGNDTVCIWNRPTYLPYRIHQEQDTDGKESGGLQLHGRGTGIDTHEPKYELICSIRFEESTVYGAKHRTY